MNLKKYYETIYSYVVKLIVPCHTDNKSRHFAIKYATKNLVYYNGPMMQGFRILKALVSSGLYNFQALRQWAIVTNSGIYSIYIWQKPCINLQIRTACFLRIFMHAK